MNGPEHYQFAERLVAGVAQGGGPEAAEAIAVAQVHATLALAAATALGTDLMRAADGDAWRTVAATERRY